MRASKYLGFAVLMLGGLVMAAGAALPLTVDRGAGVLDVRFHADGCGPAAYAAVRDSESDCQRRAHRRLLGTTTIGLLLVVTGLVMFADGDSHESRIDVPFRRVRRRRTRSPGSTRCRPG